MNSQCSRIILAIATQNLPVEIKEAKKDVKTFLGEDNEEMKE